MSRKRKEIDTSTYVGRFAVRLRTLRENAKLTVDELAMRTGIPVQTLYGWENTKAIPSVDKIPSLKEALGVSFESMLQDH